MLAVIKTTHKIIILLIILSVPFHTRSQSTLCFSFDGNEEIANLILPFLIEYDLPAIGAAIVRTTGDISVGVVGTREVHGNQTARVNDIWHIGSCMKAMTATLMGRLVEDGFIDWETTIADIFPEISKNFINDLGQVTVKMLLSHKSKLTRDLDYTQFSDIQISKQRLKAVIIAGSDKAMLLDQAEYSNLGYAICGAIVEKITNKTFEEAIHEKLFQPLKITSATFQGEKTDFNIPKSHQSNGQILKNEDHNIYDPAILRSAGCTRITLNDWGLFIQDQLKGANNLHSYLKPETYEMLHNPIENSGYALGWGVANRDWGNGKVLNHSGSNGLNYSNVWVAPNKGFAVLICINQGGTFNVTDEIAGNLIRYINKGE